MFRVRTIHPESGTVEAAEYDLIPALPQGQVVCNLFAEFLAGQPGEFRERLPFLKKGDIELEWAAASGGAAYMAFFAGGTPVGMGVLLAGADAEADEQMKDALRTSVLDPMVGSAAAEMLQAPERPVAWFVELPERPEWNPTVRLLVTALASVYFRAVQSLAAS